MRSLKARRSSRVRESDLAITGTTFTTSESFLRTTMSIGLRLPRTVSPIDHMVIAMVLRRTRDQMAG